MGAILNIFEGKVGVGGNPLGGAQLGKIYGVGKVVSSGTTSETNLRDYLR